jgi:hypothetical protein
VRDRPRRPAAYLPASTLSLWQFISACVLVGAAWRSGHGAASGLTRYHARLSRDQHLPSAVGCGILVFVPLTQLVIFTSRRSTYRALGIWSRAAAARGVRAAVNVAAGPRPPPPDVRRWQNEG